MSDEDWHELEESLNCTFSNLMASLRHTHPNLREKDFRLCMMLKLGLTNADLAEFYCLSMSGVKQCLLRLKKRLALGRGDGCARDYIRTR